MTLSVIILSCLGISVNIYTNGMVITSFPDKMHPQVFYPQVFLIKGISVDKKLWCEVVISIDKGHCGLCFVTSSVPISNAVSKQLIPF